MSNNDAIQVDKFHRACTEMYNFRVPTTKLTTDFKASFKNSTNSEESTNLVEKLILTRADMQASLISDAQPESKLAAVDNYLPNILLLMNTLQSQEKITFDKSLSFEWKGSLHTDETFYKSAYITYEVMMVLHTKVNNFISVRQKLILFTIRQFSTAMLRDILLNQIHSIS